jgi:hypothetical protein
VTNTERVVTHITYLVVLRAEGLCTSGAIGGVINTNHITAHLTDCGVRTAYHSITGLARREMISAELLLTEFTFFSMRWTYWVSAI